MPNGLVTPTQVSYHTHPSNLNPIPMANLDEFYTSLFDDGDEEREPPNEEEEFTDDSDEEDEPTYDLDEPVPITSLMRPGKVCQAEVE
jgi:hypothetical protein